MPLGFILGSLLWGLLLAALWVMPVALIVFRRSTLDPAKKWTAAVATAAAFLGSLLVQEKRVPAIAFICLEWLIYLAYQDVQRRRALPSRRRLAGTLSALVALGLTSFLLESLYNSHLQSLDRASSHIAAWPLDAYGTRWVDVRYPPGYPRRYSPLPRAAGSRDAVEIPTYFVNLLWPDLVPRDDDNADAFGEHDQGQRVLHLQISGLAQDEGVDKLQLEYDRALQNNRKFCVSPQEARAQARCFELPVPDSKPPAYGLTRVGIDYARHVDLASATLIEYGSKDIWFAPAGGPLQTVITCTPDEIVAHGTPPICNHSFIYAPWNARVTVTYVAAYLEQWQTIQTSLAGVLDKMRP